MNVHTWVIMKTHWKATGTTVVPAFICFSKGDATRRCKTLNERAKKCVYKAQKVPNGGME